MKAPLVSVLLPARNAQPFVDEALQSLASQSYHAFEIIVIDDGSTDGTAEKVQAWTRQDARFKTTRTEGVGVAAALNVGLELARGRLIARMDADDRSHPDRLRRQVDAMAAHAEVGVCGTWARTFGQSSHTWRPAGSSARIAAGLVFDAVMIHPTVMIRRELLDINARVKLTH
jgi:glycosyltransferase involved in cell wall biosynthesis